MPRLEKFRLFSWIAWLLGLLVGTYGYLWYRGFNQPENLWPGLPFAVNWGSIISLLGFGIVFAATHYLVVIGRATDGDFSMLAAFSIVSFFLFTCYWTETGASIFSGFVVLLIALGLEYLYPNWLEGLVFKVRSVKD